MGQSGPGGKACWPELTDPAAAFAAAWTLVLSTASSYCL